MELFGWVVGVAAVSIILAVILYNMVEGLYTTLTTESEPKKVAEFVSILNRSTPLPQQGYTNFVDISGEQIPVIVTSDEFGQYRVYGVDNYDHIHGISKSLYAAKYDFSVSYQRWVRGGYGN